MDQQAQPYSSHRLASNRLASKVPRLSVEAIVLTTCSWEIKNIRERTENSSPVLLSAAVPGIGARQNISQLPLVRDPLSNEQVKPRGFYRWFGVA